MLKVLVLIRPALQNQTLSSYSESPVLKLLLKDCQLLNVRQAYCLVFPAELCTYWYFTTCFMLMASLETHTKVGFYRTLHKPDKVLPENDRILMLHLQNASWPVSSPWYKMYTNRIFVFTFQRLLYFIQMLMGKCFICRYIIISPREMCCIL